MPQFDAHTIVEPISVRLLPHADFDGVIPEPSDQDIGAFLAGVRELSGSESLRRMGLVPGADLATPEEAAGAAEALDPEEFVEAMDSLTGLFALLCGGKPTKEQLLTLPFRKRILFFSFLQAAVMTPEAAPGAGNAQEPTLPSAAAG